MSRAESLLTSVVSEVLGALPADLNSSKALLEIRGWDSVKFVQLLVKIEAEAVIRFQASEVVSIKTWGELVQLVEKKLE